MKTKEIYETLDMSIITFDNVDVITDSLNSNLEDGQTPVIDA